MKNKKFQKRLLAILEEHIGFVNDEFSDVKSILEELLYNKRNDSSINGSSGNNESIELAKTSGVSLCSEDVEEEIMSAADLIEYYKAEFGFETDKQLAEVLGIHKNTPSVWVNRNFIPESRIEQMEDLLVEMNEATQENDLSDSELIKSKLESYKNGLNVKTYTQLAAILGVTQSCISKWIEFGKIPQYWMDFIEDLMAK